MKKIKVTVLGLWSSAHIGETPSFLIESDTCNILLDMCPGVTRQLKRANFSLAALDIAFGSHVHADHLSGSTYLTFQHFLETRSTTPNKHITFCGTKEVLSAIDAGLKLYYPERIFKYDSITISDEKISTYENEKVKLSFAKGKHAVDVRAIRIDIVGCPSVFYTADGFFTDEIYELANGADLLIGEAFGTMDEMKDRYKTVMHSLGIHLGELANNSNVMHVIPFHMGFKYNNVANRELLLDEIRQNYKGEIIWAGDNLFSIEI